MKIYVLKIEEYDYDYNYNENYYFKTHELREKFKEEYDYNESDDKANWNKSMIGEKQYHSNIKATSYSKQGVRYWETEEELEDLEDDMTITEYKELFPSAIIQIGE